VSCPGRFILIALGTLALCAFRAPWPAPQSTFRSEVDVVSVPVAVMNGSRPVAGLASSDFTLLDNGVAQDITAASVETLAVDVTLVLDTSGSVQGRLLEQFKADLQTISDLLQANDRVRLITFGTGVREAFGPQPGGAPLPVDEIRANGATSFYNALASALVLTQHVQRPHLIFGFSDGLDSASFLDAADVRALAGFSGASLYLTLTRPVLTGSEEALRIHQSLTPFAGGPDLSSLRDAVARTGGVLYRNPSDGRLPVVFRQVLDEFRTSYVLTYTQRGVTRLGWHQIVVHTANAHYTVRTRTGYEGG